MKFILEIKLGNAEMCSNHHLAKALSDVAVRIKKGKAVMPPSLSAKIFDVCGNSVGKWELKEE